MGGGLARGPYPQLLETVGHAIYHYHLEMVLLLAQYLQGIEACPVEKSGKEDSRGRDHQRCCHVPFPFFLWWNSLLLGLGIPFHCHSSLPHHPLLPLPSTTSSHW